MTNKSIVYALTKLCPGTLWTLRGDNLDGLEWLDQTTTRPTNKEIIDVAATYIKPPTLEEQLEAIWKGGTDMEDMRVTVLAVKSTNPKV